MGMERQTLVGAILTLISIAASGAEEPAGSQQLRPGYKGTPLGTTTQEFLQKHPLFHCGQPNRCALFGFRPDVQCAGLARAKRSPPDCHNRVVDAATYANQQADVFIEFRDDKLLRVMAWVEPSGYLTVIGALSTTYGPPRQTDPRQHASWNIGGDEITAARTRPGPSATGPERSIVLISSKEALDEAKTGERKGRKAADDL